MYNSKPFFLFIGIFLTHFLYGQTQYDYFAKTIQLNPGPKYILVKMEIPIVHGNADNKLFHKIEEYKQLTNEWSATIIQDAKSGELNLRKLCCFKSRETFEGDSNLIYRRFWDKSLLAPNQIDRFIYEANMGELDENEALPKTYDPMISNLLTLNKHAEVWMFFPVRKSRKAVFVAYDIIWSDPGKVAPDFPLLSTDFIKVSTQKYTLIQDSIPANKYFESLQYLWKPIEGQSLNGSYMNFNSETMKDNWKKKIQQGYIPSGMYRQYFKKPIKD